MKQWIALLFAVMVVGLALPAALADDGSNGSINISDNTTINASSGLDMQTLHEIEAMDGSFGAQMRMLQLEKAIEQRILYAQAILPVVENKTNVSANDTTQLQADITTLQALYDNATTTPTNTSDAVKQYVDIKQEADRTIANFRRIARHYLTPEDIQSLTVQFQNIDKTQLDAIDQQIKQALDNFNADRIQLALNAMGVTNDQLVADVRSGNISAGDARAMLRDTFSGLTRQQRIAAAIALQEWNTRIKVQREVHMTEVSENMANRLAMLTQRLSDRLNNAGFPIAAERLQNESERFQNLSANIEQWMENRSNGTRPFLGIRGGNGPDNGPFQPGEYRWSNGSENVSGNMSADENGTNATIGGTQ